MMALVLWGAVAVGDPQTRYVSSLGSNTAPYTNWTMAATSIQPAVTAAVAGDTVLVSNGVYTAAVTGYIVTIDKAITMRSLNGAEVTIIDPLVGTTSTARHNLSLTATAAGAVVDGFTLQGTYNRGTAIANSALNLQAGTVTNCVIRNNTVTGGVGGAAVSGTGLLVDCVVSNNLSTEWQNGRGGGIYLNGGTVERCRIVDNTTACWLGGAGVYMLSGTLRNCIVGGNNATFFISNQDPEVYHGGGGGVFMSKGTIENCTIAGNEATGRGAGLYATGGTVKNSIVYNNISAYRWPAERDLYGAAAVSYSCAPWLSLNNGNVTNTPSLRSVTDGDYTLLPGSSCIDAGTTISGFAEDINLTSRPIGFAWDIGAHETPLSGDQPFTCNFTATPTEGVDSVTVDFTPHFAGANTDVTWYRWQFGDGNVDTGAAAGAISHTYLPGMYDVTLSVSNSAGEADSETKAAFIRVSSYNLYVSTNGTHTFPFDSPAKAANNIAAAVAAAPNSTQAVVWVGDGTWKMSTQVKIEKAVTVRSLNGPTKTTTSVPGQQRSFCLFHPDAVVDGFTMTTSGQGNHVMDGAGVFMLQGTVTNCIIRNIVIGGRGAAIWMAGGRVVDCHLHDNRTYEWQYGYGGGIYIENYSQYGEALAENCRIERNECQSKRGGGGVYMKRGTLRNCLIVSNSATYNIPSRGYGIGGGVCMVGGMVENSTVTRNFSIQSGGGVHMGNASAELVNTIVYDNSVLLAVDGERNLFNIGGTVGFSCIAPVSSGIGNTDANPLFIDPDALNFCLQTASPCMDSGRYAAWMDGAVDLNGDRRIINGAVDMGCFEVPDPWDGPLVSGFSAEPVSGFKSLETVFTAEPVGANTNIVRYTWTFGDGSTVSGSDKAVVTNTYAPGYYDVMLEMKNTATEVSSISRANYIKVAPAIAYVATNSTPKAPYLSWATAASTFQDALNVVRRDGTGDHTILEIGAGTYAIGGELVLSTNTTVRGHSGKAEDAVFLGTSPLSRVFTLSHPGVTLTGVTVAGGYNPDAYFPGGGIYLSAGVVSNCLIRDNLAGGQGGGIHLTGGLVTHTTFRNNTANEWNYGYGGGLFISGGLAEHCVFDANICNGRGGGGGVYQNGGTVRNCLLMRNAGTQTSSDKRSPGGGLRIAGGLFESSTVVSNSAIINGGGIDMTGGMVSNTIVADNYVTMSGATNWHNPMALVGHCLSPDLVDNPAKGNIAGSPVFENAAALNFRLARNSPGLDVGRNQAWMENARDLDGRPRILLGRWPRVTPENTTDMGAYELYLPPPGAMIILR